MTIPTFGSRIQVFRGHAKKTSGGLTKSSLMMNKHGRVVSRSKHNSAKKEMRLLKHGYGTKKGKFGFVKVGSKTRKNKSRKMRGGMHTLSPLELAEDSTDVQFRAGQAGGSGMAPLASSGAADWSGDGISGAGITDFGMGSTGVQMRAGMSGGGLSRALRRSRSSSRSRSVAQRGGWQPRLSVNTISKALNPGLRAANIKLPRAVAQRGGWQPRLSVNTISKALNPGLKAANIKLPRAVMNTPNFGKK